MLFSKELTLEKPTPIEVNFSNRKGLVDYYEKCEKVRLSAIPADLIDLFILDTLKNIVPVYDNDRVTAYMDNLVRVENRKRKWFQEKKLVWGWKVIIGSIDYIPNRLGNTDYDRLIPGYILDRCDLVKSTFAREFESTGYTFYRTSMSLMISDYDVERPDPFLGLWSHASKKLYVIGVWDEPGF